MKTWLKILLATGITVALFIVAWLLLRLIWWVGANHFEWFIYFILFVVFCGVAGFVYDIIDEIVKDKERRRSGKPLGHVRPNLW